MNAGIFALTMALAPVAAPPAPPMPVPSPFLFVKMVAPKGVTTIWYPGTKAAVTGDIPVGLRAGYCYRLELGNLPEHPNTSIYPSIEVRGSLMIRDQLDVTKHPVPVTLTEDDILSIFEGRFISKVYYLEDPQQANTAPTQPGEPFEMRAASEEEAIKEARQKGRLVLILRVGERGFMPDELARGNVPGTILFASAKRMPVPAAPPCVPYGNIRLYDPLIGVKIPGEECFHDGGDQLRPLGIGDGGKLYGVDASDTAIEFTTIKGRKFATSNRVCICIPRFAALKSESAPNGYIGVRSLGANTRVERNSLMAQKVPSKTVKQTEQFAANSGTMRPSGMQAELTLAVKTTLVGKPTAVYRLNGTKSVAELREVEEITVYPGCNLILQKRMDPPNPQRIGEEVTFFLRFYNPTPHDMTEVIINDSLTGRLEYIAGTQKSSRPTTFTATTNEAGSLHLKWAIDGKILPGESGVVSFRARIR